MRAWNLVLPLLFVACATGVAATDDGSDTTASASAAGGSTASSGAKSPNASGSGGGNATTSSASGAGGSGGVNSSTAAGGATGSSMSSSMQTSSSSSVSSSSGGGGNPVLWINEIHYDNTGTDNGEGVEIAGSAGLNLSSYALELHNGGGPALYNTISLSGAIPNQQNGYGVLWFSLPSNGLQNGPSDGIALVNTTTNQVVQFLSYEGTLMASDGKANGQSSVDIGVSESSGTAVGHSLQLGGVGLNYASFTWQPAAVASPGLVNSGQTFQ